MLKRKLNKKTVHPISYNYDWSIGEKAFIYCYCKSPTQRQSGQSVEIIQKAPSENPITEKPPTETPIENTSNQKIKITVKKKHTLKKKITPTDNNLKLFLK